MENALNVEAFFTFLVCNETEQWEQRKNWFPVESVFSAMTEKFKRKKKRGCGEPWHQIIFLFLSRQKYLRDDTCNAGEHCQLLEIFQFLL